MQPDASHPRMRGWEAFVIIREAAIGSSAQLQESYADTV